MLTLTPTAAALVALVCGAWLAVALWATVRGIGLSRRSAARIGDAERAAALLGAHVAVPALLRGGGWLEADGRLAGLLGLDSPPTRMTDLCGGGCGLPAEEGSALAELAERA